MKPIRPERIKSIDVFRGITMFLLVGEFTELFSLITDESLDGSIIAHTLKKEPKGNINPWPQLQSTAENNEYGEATSIVLVDKLPFQIMVYNILMLRH